jgi:hypothetical protein
MIQKAWVRPELTVLVRTTSQENVLDKCKHNTSSIDTLANSHGSSPNSSHSSCRNKIKGHGHGHEKVCEGCQQPISS